MSVFGQLIHTGLKLAPKKPIINFSPQQFQIKVLHRLLKTAEKTAFGKKYDFKDLLRLKDPRQEYKAWMPVFTYESMYQAWWHRSRQDEPNISWPGIIPYYGVSSGSTHSSSKYIPITFESLSAWNKVAQRIFTSFSNYKQITPSLLGKQALLVGGTSKLTKEGLHLCGDCSGIMAKNRPYWMRSLYKPDQFILEMPEWQQRIEKIIQSTPDWDIAFLVGNVAWVQLIMEEIKDRYGLDHIHQIWPHLTLLLHSGIFFEPYKESFEKLLKHPLLYLDSYSATEGVFAFQEQIQDNSMKLLLNQGVYYEFIPFDAYQFDEEGNLKSEFPDCIPIEDVEENKPYAILLSTTSGAWHYLLGDIIQFTDKNRCKIIIKGRTKNNLNLTGEHLSEGNIVAAIQHLNKVLPNPIKEFCVIGERYGAHFGHRWYIGSNGPHETERILKIIDEFLKSANDDYAIQRAFLLKQINIELVPIKTFYDWLDQRGKMNGQAKIPRILTSSLKENWMHFIGHSKALSALS